MRLARPGVEDLEHVPLVDPEAHAVAPPQMQSVVSVGTSVSVLVEVDGSASSIVGLLVVISIEVSAVKDVAAVCVGLWQG